MPRSLYLRELQRSLSVSGLSVTLLCAIRIKRSRNTTLTERQETIFQIAYVLKAFGKDVFLLAFCCDHSLLLTAMRVFP